MPECPTCGSEFDSRRGLGVHHSQAHDVLLPNRDCHHCGTEFHSEHEKKYCSDDCRDTAVSFEGENHPNYRDAREETTCDICGTIFEYYPSEKKGLYYGSCVRNENWRYRPEITGEENPLWEGGQQELDCEQCGATVFRWPSNITSKYVFCSDECQYAWLSKTFTGEGHPNWDGGGEANYGPGWHRARRRALERDEYTCVRCGASRDELGRNPDVHHLLPVRAFVETPATSEADAHYVENLVSLCPACHRQVEFADVDPDLLRAPE